MQMQHDKIWLKNNNPFHAESGVNTADDFDEMACDYHEHMASPLVERIAELEAALDKEHRESWAADLLYEPHPLLVKEK